MPDKQLMLKSIATTCTCSLHVHSQSAVLFSQMRTCWAVRWDLPRAEVQGVGVGSSHEQAAGAKRTVTVEVYVSHSVVVNPQTVVISVRLKLARQHRSVAVVSLWQGTSAQQSDTFLNTVSQGFLKSDLLRYSPWEYLLNRAYMIHLIFLNKISLHFSQATHEVCFLFSN